MRERLRGRIAAERREGIALLVVMVVFIILYLVVFQLNYTTRLEERLAKARSSDIQGSSAIQSVGYYILTLLGEDFQSGQQQQQQQSSSTSTGGTPAGTSPRGTGASAATIAKSAGKPAGDLQSSSGSDPAALDAGAGTGSGPSWYDYRHKNIFLQNEQSLNGTKVKIVIIDNERSFDLNQLWTYPPIEAETLSEQNQEQTNRDAQKDANTAAGILSKSGDPSARATASALKSAGSSSRTTARGAAGTPGATMGQATDQNGNPILGDAQEWVPPTDVQRQAVVKMLTRAIDLMYRLNTENGFEYRTQPPNKDQLAIQIERYAYERRSQLAQNYIHLTSELLNVVAMVGGTPEVYYGPMPAIAADEEFYDRSRRFRYKKDEYGDLIGEYVAGNADAMALDREAMQKQLSDLQETFGQFASFPGLGRMGDPLTRNMKEVAEDYDEQGRIALMVPPQPIGLKDIFCTFSTGKININTASVPVLYALLNLIIDYEPNGELQAQTVALNIQAYLNAYQPEVDDSDPTKKSDDASGAPHRTAPNASSTGMGSRGGPGMNSRDLAGQLLGSSGAAGLAGLSQDELASAVGSGNTDYQTNYFTKPDQIKLIDGEDGGRDDYLTDKGSAADTRELAKKTPLQKVLHDYFGEGNAGGGGSGGVMVFGSTYFTATLKSKTEESPAVKTGYLTVQRDVAGHRMAIVQWKELQR